MVRVTRKLLKSSFLGEMRGSLRLIIGGPCLLHHWHKFEKIPEGFVTLHPTDRAATTEKDQFFLTVYGGSVEYARMPKDHEYLRHYVYDFAPGTRVVNIFGQDCIFVAEGLASSTPFESPTAERLSLIKKTVQRMAVLVLGQQNARRIQEGRR
ncbi:hypothetical protein DENSPDRAFT_878679 [Dentipellis sp. KUC8613]|nr:hypothetical protein DENSPDRAFT_878679 [Dentipellis sp. KUC8613]